LARAKERFAKEVAARRKPHVILGDILGLDGKPIPNVDAYSVYVYGTTIAAEKTHYGLDVDANGHFEQQVPDGLYKVTATCIVNHDGHKLPVDLVWLDDKKVGVDQSSDVGIVRDFRLVMTGLKPGEDPKGQNAFYGGSLDVNGPPYDLYKGHLSTRFPGTTLQLTLTAQSSLVDGSRIDPFTIDIPVENVNYAQHLQSIQIGTYVVTATLVSKDGTKRALQLGTEFGGALGNSAEIHWQAMRDYKEQREVPRIYLRD